MSSAPQPEPHIETSQKCACFKRSSISVCQLSGAELSLELNEAHKSPVNVNRMLPSRGMFQCCRGVDVDDSSDLSRSLCMEWRGSGNYLPR
jgi:hypothetical protein